MQNFATSQAKVADSGEVQLFEGTIRGSDFRRLYIRLSEFERRGGESAIFGAPRLRRDVFAIRSAANQAAASDKSIDSPGLLQGPFPVMEVSNLEKLRE